MDPSHSAASTAQSRPAGRGFATRHILRGVSLGAAALVAGAAPLSLMGIDSSAAVPTPSETMVAAAPYTTLPSNKCTAGIYPFHEVSLTADGQKQIVFNVTLKCDTNRKVRFQSQLWEQDNGKPGDVGGSDLIAQRSWSSYIDATSSTVTRKVAFPVASSYDSAPDRWGEFYHRVRIQVVVTGEDPFNATSYTSGPVKSAFI